jgi:hypothetical protein
MTLRPQDRIHRVADAIVSGRLEGVEPSEEFLSDAAEYVAGLIDDAEFMERGLRRWGLA